EPHTGGGPRVTVGFMMLLVAVCGLFHLVAGSPDLGGPVGALRDAGGLLGAGVGGPLRRVLAPVGAGFVLTLVLVLAYLVITDTSVRSAVDAVTMVCLAIGRTIGRFGRWLVSVGQRPEPAGADEEP